MKDHRIFLPAKNSIIESDNERSAVETLCRYIHREFPGIDGAAADGVVYSVPRQFNECKNEKQAQVAEEILFQRLHQMKISKQWCVFFHGRSYGGVSHRNERNGKYIMREHDFVVFTTYQGSRYLILIEVKSTCDDAIKSSKQQLPFILKISDSKSIKNNKRGAQHQLRDHIEMILQDLNENDKNHGNIQTYIAWPFLSGTTKNQQQPVKRWQEDGSLHIFKETLNDQLQFENWWLNIVLRDHQKMPESQWMVLLQKFIVLSCGVFIDELHEGMMTLLSQSQLQILSGNNLKRTGQLVIHGAAGTGKTMLIVYKLWQLYNRGELHEKSRALYICYWPAIRDEVARQLDKMGIGKFVDSARFYIALDGFLKRQKNHYNHIFMDEAEAICLAFNEQIVQDTFTAIEAIRLSNDGCLWYLVDVNQAAMFRIKHDNVLHKPDVVLDQVMRSTKNVFKIFQSLFKSANVSQLGHDIEGPPVFWAEVRPFEHAIDRLIDVVIDLCLTKGLKPNDLCALPFYITDQYREDFVNSRIRERFAPDAYMPQALADVELFLANPHPSQFLLPWSLRIKGLDFRVIIIIVDASEDWDSNDPEDRRKMYIMASRCSCLLILIATETVKTNIDVNNAMIRYPFHKLFNTSNLMNTTTHCH